MDSFTKQENSPQRKTLRTLLSTLIVPPKAAHDWQRLENDLFLALDEQNGKSMARPLHKNSFFQPRFAFFISAAAAMVIMLIGVGVSIANKTSKSNLSVASLASVQGHVAVLWGGKGQWDTISSVQSGSLGKTAKAGTIIASQGKSSAILLLDKGNIVKVYENSRLVISASTPQNQVCVLACGSVLAKVAKRSEQQNFEIHTPCANVKIIGTVFRVDADSMIRTTLSVFHGKVAMTSTTPKTSAKVVSTGEKMSIDHNGVAFNQRIGETEMPINDISVLSMIADETNALSNSFAVVDISSDPLGAKVMINNLMVGTTPLFVKKEPGMYSVVIVENGFTPLEKSLVVSNNRYMSLYAELLPSSATRQPQNPIKHITIKARKCQDELRLIPEYVEALVNISIGEYQRALSILDSLSNSGIIDIRLRMCIMQSVNECYKKIGDFAKAEDQLENRLAATDASQTKAQILWELANIRANCLGDYEGAEMALVEFLILEPDALWAQNAYSKLAEVQYFNNKFRNAAETYRKHISLFPKDPDIDKSLYNLACITGQDIGDNKKAAELFTKIIVGHQKSKYLNASYFKRGETYLKLGKTEAAAADFSSYLSLQPDGIFKTLCLEDLKRCKAVM